MRTRTDTTGEATPVGLPALCGLALKSATITVTDRSIGSVSVEVAAPAPTEVVGGADGGATELMNADVLASAPGQTWRITDSHRISGGTRSDA